MGWKDTLQHRQEIILSTSTKSGEPNAIVVLSMGIIDGKLLIANCLMKSTIDNIRLNPNVCVISTSMKEHYRLKGLASEFFTGDFFDAAIKKSSPTPPVKSAIAIEIKEVFDLDKGQKIL